MLECLVVNEIFVSYCIVLYCIVLYCIVLYCIVLYCLVMLPYQPEVRGMMLGSMRMSALTFTLV